MIRLKNSHYRPIVIDLTGPAGNAFSLLGNARAFAKQLGYTQDEIKTLTDEMMAGDYENLIQVFDKAFGSFVTLER